MPAIEIFGYSDDLIEVEGDIEAEFYWIARDDERRFVTVSDGTILEMVYDQDGIWRITPITRGTAEYSKVDGSVKDDTNDKVTLIGEDVRWVALATDYCFNNQKQNSNL